MAETESKTVLHSYYRSSCSWRVRIAMAFKGIKYEYKAVNLLSRIQLEEEFQKLNPNCELPILEHNGNVLTNSNAIMEYLEEIRPSPALLPGNALNRAKIRAIVDTIVSDIQPIQNLRVLKKVERDPMDWGKFWIERGFGALESILQGTHGLFCVGDNVTLADVCLVPQVFNAKRFCVDMSQYPLINEISSRLLGLPAFKVSHPHVQPDCPEEFRGM